MLVCQQSERMAIPAILFYCAKLYKITCQLPAALCAKSPAICSFAQISRAKAVGQQLSQGKISHAALAI